MGRVFAWKLKKWDNGTWKYGYSWLSSVGGFSETVPAYEDLDSARELARNLTSIDEYESAFQMMLANVPQEYKCSTRLESAENYFNNTCEWGGQNGYCGVAPPPNSISLSISPETIVGTEGNFFATITTVNINEADVHFYIDGGSDCFAQTTKVKRKLSSTTYEYTLTLVISSYGEHRGEAKSGSLTSGVKYFSRVNDIYSMSFNPSSANVSAETTTASSTLVTNNITGVTVESCGGSNCSNSGNIWTMTFPSNTGTTTTSAKTYRLKLKGYSSLSGAETSATFTVNQDGYTPPPPPCTPEIMWSKSSETVNANTTTTTIGFTASCYETITVTSSSTSFPVTANTSSGNAAILTFAANTSVDPRSTTLTIKAVKGSDEATSTLTLTQNGMDVNGSISLVGSSSAAYAGSTNTYTATTNYVVWSNVEVSDQSVSVTNISNTGSTSTGTSGVNVTFNVVFPSIATTGTTNVTVATCDNTSLNVTVPNYNIDSGSSSGTLVCVKAPTKTVTITVKGRDKNNVEKTDSITVVQS